MISLAQYRALLDIKIKTILDSLDCTQWPATFDSMQLYQDFLAPAKSLLTQGKRTRAAFIASGWQLFSTPQNTDCELQEQMPLIAGSAIEFYQASALIHDDIIDAALSRRGMPAVHIAFMNFHQKHELIGNCEKFGFNSGILLGDFLLSLAAQTFSKAEHQNDAALNHATELFHAMTAEVALGQYLDNRCEFTLPDENYDQQIAHALRVLFHKSARYSVDCPLKIGAALQGAKKKEIARLSQIGIPLGEAFQLRDDQLGVFGDETKTGKPSDSDLIEGKRTVLLALTRKMANPNDKKTVDTLIGTEISQIEADQIRNIMIDCGAVRVHEEMILQRERQALAEIQKLPVKSLILDELIALLNSRTA